MIEGVPSRTAIIVAGARSLAGAGATAWGHDIDPHAATLLPRSSARVHDLIARFASSGRLPAGIVRLLSGGLIEHAGLRTLAIDAAAREAVARGASQTVVLGAGLDVRAYRLEPLRLLRLFEVDHPSTQAYKTRRAGSLSRDGEVTYVSVDFGRERLEDRLIAAGLDVASPTLWVWEGVTPYLSAASRLASLDAVSRLSAPGSTLIMSYMTPEVATIPRWFEPVVRAAFNALGEPLIGDVTPEAIASELDARGWSVVSDEGTREWARRFAPGAPPWFGFHERVVVASRRPA
jgi:methyltransferase (TIGR00027 family)